MTHTPVITYRASFCLRNVDIVLYDHQSTPTTITIPSESMAQFPQDSVHASDQGNVCIIFIYPAVVDYLRDEMHGSMDAYRVHLCSCFGDTESVKGSGQRGNREAKSNDPGSGRTRVRMS